MPKSTFYKISDDKRKRILDAAAKEFLSCAYNEASINKIIKDAGIPRGSFYQYFEDKEDLFKCFMEENNKLVFNAISSELDSVDGDVFECIDNLIDKFVESVISGKDNILNLLASTPIVMEIFNASHDKDLVRNNYVLSDKINTGLFAMHDEEDLNNIGLIVSSIIRDNVRRITLCRDYDEMRGCAEEFHTQIRMLKKCFYTRN